MMCPYCFKPYVLIVGHHVPLRLRTLCPHWVNVQSILYNAYVLKVIKCVPMTDVLCPQGLPRMSSFKESCVHKVLNLCPYSIYDFVLTIQACVLKVVVVRPHAILRVSLTIIAHVLMFGLIQPHILFTNHLYFISQFCSIVYEFTLWIHTSFFLRLYAARVFTQCLPRFFLGLPRVFRPRRFREFFLF